MPRTKPINQANTMRQYVTQLLKSGYRRDDGSVSITEAPLRVHLAFVGVASFLVLCTIGSIQVIRHVAALGERNAPVIVLGVPTTTIPAVAVETARAYAFAALSLTASSAIVVDLSNNEVLFSKNADAPHALASVTKLMTAVVATERLPKDAYVAIDPSDLAPEGESNLIPGDRFKLSALLNYTLITSSNDGARAIATAAGALAAEATSTGEPDDLLPFIEAMNAKAKAIGMTDTRFDNESGLDISFSTPGSTGSARDVAKLLSYIHHTHPDLLSATAKPYATFQSEGGAVYSAANTNTELSHFSTISASKTGFTDIAGGNLAILVDVDLNRTLAVVVLGSTQAGRFADAEKLVEASNQYFKARYP